MSEDIAENIYDIYEKSHIPVLVAFLAIYLLYIGISSVIKSTIPTVTDSQLHTAFDVVVAVVIVIYTIYAYSALTSIEQNNVLQIFWNWCLDFYSSDNMILAATVFILVFYFIVFCFKITLHNSPYSLHLLESKAWIFLATLFLVFALNRVFNTNVIRYLYVTDDNISIWDTRFKYWGDKVDVQSDVSNKKSISGGSGSGIGSGIGSIPEQRNPQQVFNVANNIYTYNDAKLVCKSMGARLATYDEVEKSYKNGGEWCNFGWTEGQMALFPTQLSTWYLLQTDNKTKNSCGRPGINGGYIMNPHQKYGVNCYGTKPAKKNSDINPASYVMPSTDSTPSLEDIEEEKRLKFWKNYGNQITQLNSFNRSRWSE